MLPDYFFFINLIFFIFFKIENLESKIESESYEYERLVVQNAELEEIKANKVFFYSNLVEMNYFEMYVSISLN